MHSKSNEEIIHAIITSGAIKLLHNRQKDNTDQCDLFSSGTLGFLPKTLSFILWDCRYPNVITRLLR